jgi:peroxiredoxin
MHAYRDQYAQIFNLGRDVVLIAISADPVEELAAWARDDEFPFLLASDPGLEMAATYGATVERDGQQRLGSRSLFVVGPDGRIAHAVERFREIDPTAYEALEEVIDRLTAPADEGG